MLRGLLNSVFLAVATIVGSLLAITFRLFDASGDTVIRLAQTWSRVVLRASGVELVVHQRVPLEAGKPYLFMANHLSMVDIWALFVALPMPVRMIAKKQLGRIPLFGWAMRAGRFVFIDRDNPVRARRSMEEASRRIADGAPVLLFPEGTRSRDGQLGPFKKGGFYLAIGSQVPIVPVAITGARAVMPPGSPLIRPGRVTVTIGEPIATAGLRDTDRDALLGRVREAIAGMLQAP